MDFNTIKKVVTLLKDTDIQELTWDEVTGSLTIKRLGAVGQFSAPQIQMPVQSFTTLPQSPASGSEKIDDDSYDSDDYFTVKAPLVGTFYSAPAPDADPFVKEGHEVSKGSVLCIVEAMKIMNEIESEVSGKIVKILAENGKAVEYGQDLFIIEKD